MEALKSPKAINTAINKNATIDNNKKEMLEKKMPLGCFTFLTCQKCR